MANATVVRPDPREAVQFAQDLADSGHVLVSVTLDSTAPVKGTVVYTVAAQNEKSLTPAQIAANRAILATAATGLNSADAGGADSK